MAKPIIFLSHSKSDKDFVAKVAYNLNAAGVSCWYDEWEIAPGDSLRRKIFEDGIPICDVFVVYITENSVSSKWVSDEIDAAYIKDMDIGGGSFALFVSSEEVRKRLSSELRSKHCPVFNEAEYALPLAQIVNKAWISHIKRKELSKAKDHELEILRLQNTILELEQKAATHSVVNNPFVVKVSERLKAKKVQIDDKDYTLAEIFIEVGPYITIPKFGYDCNDIIKKRYKSPELNAWGLILTPLIVFGLVHTYYQKFEGHHSVATQEMVATTDFGKQVLVELGYSLE